MIGAKIRVPQNSLVYRYNEEFDILDIFIEKITPSISEQLCSGLYNYIDIDTEMIAGISIEDYTKRNKEIIKDFLAFDVDFDYIDKNIAKIN